VNVGRGGGVVDVDEIVRRERGVEGDAQKAAFARGIHGDGDERRGFERVVADDAQGPALLGDVEAVGGSECHGGGVREAGGDLDFAETGGERGRECARGRVLGRGDGCKERKSEESRAVGARNEAREVGREPRHVGVLTVESGA
jgi:hypothetical protein